jgi:peptide chain release factor 1
VDDPGEVEIDPNDLRVDVFRSSGPGGQSVNTTDSAVRITHVPTGIVVSCQNEKSQLQNKEQALRILRARLLAVRQEAAEAAAADMRKSQVRTVDRSERIRTYNFPENRIADHRTGYKAYNLDAVLDGDLGPVIASAVRLDEAERLAAAGEARAGPTAGATR